MIEEELAILLIEDNKADAHLIERQVSKVLANPKITHIQAKKELELALSVSPPDIILCDYALKDWTGLDVLHYVKEQSRNIPFIFVTGTLNDEELAAHTILSGASGFILKDNINALPEKLRPIFQEIIRKRQVVKIPPPYREAIDNFVNTIEATKATNNIMRGEMERIIRFLEDFDQK